MTTVGGRPWPDEGLPRVTHEDEGFEFMKTTTTTRELDFPFVYLY